MCTGAGAMGAVKKRDNRDDHAMGQREKLKMGRKYTSRTGGTGLGQGRATSKEQESRKKKREKRAFQ